jgi:TetR/AcrR family tetracycline transcriptional repressor
MPEAAAASRGKRSAPQPATPRAPRFTEQDILDAALAFVRAQGIEALGMRSLAKTLGVTPMALYHYVPSKAALFDRLAESMMSTVATPEASSERWEEQLRAYARAVWDRVAVYPGLSRIALERPPLKAAGRLTMYVLSVLQAAGFDQKSAVLATVTFQSYLGSAVSAQVRRTRSRRTPRSKAARQRGKLPPEAQQFIALLSQVDPHAAREFGLDTMIAGLRAERDAERDRALAASRARN